jgi:hypothetical protein
MKDFAVDTIFHWVYKWKSENHPTPCVYSLLTTNNSIKVAADQELTGIGGGFTGGLSGVGLSLQTWEGPGELYDFHSTTPNNKLINKDSKVWFDVIKKDLKKRGSEGYCLWGEVGFSQPVTLENDKQLFGKYIFCVIRIGDSEPTCAYFNLNNLQHTVCADPELMAHTLNWTDYP